MSSVKSYTCTLSVCTLTVHKYRLYTVQAVWGQLSNNNIFWQTDFSVSLSLVLLGNTEFFLKS